MSWREIRREARRDLHAEMHVPANYYPAGSNTPAKVVGIRIHENFRYVADMKGTSYEYAEWSEESPQIVVLKDEVVPDRGDVFCPEAGEAYRVDHIDPADDITIIAHIIKLPESEAAAYQPPASP